MFMLQYVAAVKRGFRDVHGFTPSGGTEHEPLFNNIPDGEYPMEIDGKLDRVRLIDGRLSMCNFEGNEPGEDVE